MKKVIIIGSGGHAKIVIDILHSMNTLKIHGVTSNSLKKGDIFNGYLVLGDDNVLAEYDTNEYLIAMGLGGYKNSTLRTSVYKNIKKYGFEFINVIHPSAIISKTVKLGESVVIFPGVVINIDVEIGNNSIIATGSTIDHESYIGNNVLISAGVTIGGYTKIYDNTVIALGAKIISGVEIGRNVLIAAGAVVVNSVPDNETLFGIPAKPRNAFI